jgi:hypothetical protein
MSFNTEDIVQEIRAEFEAMLIYVKGSKTATADQVERGIFRRLLDLGFKLMLLFFTIRAAEYPRAPIETEAGETLPYFDDKKRDYFSIFGKLPFWRPYFYKKRVGGQSPLDEELSLGSDCYSDLLREIAEYLGVDVTYDKVREMFARILGQKLSTNAVQSMVGEDATDVEAYYEQKPAPQPGRERSAPRKRKPLSPVFIPLPRTNVRQKRWWPAFSIKMRPRTSGSLIFFRQTEIE